MIGDMAAGASSKRQWRDTPASVPAGEMKLSIDSLGELFDSLDPAPHGERDLDAHAEQFLVAWAREMQKNAALRLTIYLGQWPPEASAPSWIQDAVQHHFEEMARLTRMEFHALLRHGRVSLVIGLAFLVVCVTGGNALAGLLPGSTWPQILRETLSIGGWVAMWRPLQIYLYDWWPLKSRETLYRRMSCMPVELRPAAASEGS